MNALRLMLQRTAEDDSAQLAIVDGERRFTYGQLAAYVGDLEGALAARGIGPARRLALLLPAGVGFVAGFFATTGCGATAVLLSAAYRDQEIVDYLMLTAADAVLTDGPGAARLAGLDVDIDVFELDDGTLVGGGAGTPDGSFVDDADAILQLSSGSTGPAKVVARTVGAVAAEADAFHETALVGPDDVIYSCLPLHHAHGLANAVLAAVRAGATLIVDAAFQRGRAAGALAELGVSVLPTVPPVIASLAGSRSLRRAPPPRLRLAFTAGAPLAAVAAVAFEATTGCPVRQLYGCTEAGAVTIDLEVDRPPVDGSVGRPLVGTEVVVVDAHGRSLPPGHAGSVAIGGPSLFRGYLTDDGVDRRDFVDGRFVTGDLGRMDDGRLTLLGRRTSFINVAGSKVDPAEVERVIAALPGVVDVAVVGVVHGTTEAVKAVVVGGPVSRSEVVDACRVRLAEYKVPKIVEFRAELPRSPLGKLLGKYLVEAEHS